MIEKMKMIEYLTDGVKKELELIERYKEHVRSDKKYWEWKGRRPSKQLIIDNLKMVRRISLEIENELKSTIL
jgi:hypothetical protein